MFSMRQCYLLLFLLSSVYSAPAIVTLWETVTSRIPAGTTPTLNTQTAAIATTAQPVAVSSAAATQADSTATATSGFWGNLFNSLFDSSDSSSSSGNNAAVTNAATTSTASGSSSAGSAFASFLKGLLNGNSAESSSSIAIAPIATTATTSEIPVAKAFITSAEAVTSVSAAASSSSVPTTSSTSVATPQTSSTSTASSSSSTGDIYAAISQCDGIDESFASEILDAHNKYRTIHQVGDLSWDVDTYNYAKNNADNYDCSGILTHTHGQYGENLAAGYKDGPSTVDAWVDEPISYSANSFIYNHFTQVIWKDSTKVGCAYKDCSSTGWGLYVVCEYDPYGNVIGEGPENVFPAT